MASQNIKFDNIPSSTRKPGVAAEFNTRLALTTLPGNRQLTLIIGQRLAAGTVAANTVVDVFSDEDAAAMFGRGSIAHLMVWAALRSNPYLALSVIAADDAGAATASTWTLTLAGTATAGGVISANVGGVSVEIASDAADTANAIAAELKAQFDAQPDLPVTASVAGAVVTLTAKNKGAISNTVKVSATSTVAGATITAATGVTGQTDPTLTATLAAIFAAGHNVIISAWNDATSLAAIRNHADSVSNPQEKRGVVVAAGYNGTLSAATTLAKGNNGARLTAALAPSNPEPAWQIAADYGAVIAAEEDPAQPLNDRPLKTLSATPIANRLGRTEQENCLYNGITPTEVAPDGTVRIVRAITMYVVNSSSTPDESLLDLTTIRTLDYARKAQVDRYKLRFAGAKKTKRVKNQMREEINDVNRILEKLEILENVEANEAGVLIEDDLQNPSMVCVVIPTDVVNGLHNVGMRFDLIL